jgi:acetyl-CoA carboxylase biotin carboxyl carrier protein
LNIDFQLLERLLELLNKSSAESIEIRKSFWTTTVRVSKGGFQGNSGPVAYHVTAPPTAHAPPSGSSAPSAPAHLGGGGSGGGGGTPSHLLEIKSPMVGTFYAKPEPGADPYVRVGSRISSGQTLCIIEAMKIMNPLDAEISGVIREVAVEDAQPVEFGQVLFRVDPNG